MATHHPLESAVYVEEWFVGPLSTNFYTRTYSASSTAYGLLVFMHGAAEHTGRYTEMHTTLATQHGIAVFTVDLRGFGRTALNEEHKSPTAAYGKTGWISMMDDLEWAIETAGAKFTAVPIFVMGVSMGGTIVLGLLCNKSRAGNAAVKRVMGVIAGSPWITLTNPVPKPLVWVGRIVAAITPYIVHRVRNKPEDLSGNPLTNASYVSDPLVGTTGTLQSLGDMIVGGEMILNSGYEYWPENIPILFLHGTNDNITSYKSTVALYEKMPAKDKKIILFPNARHELHNELDGVREKSLLDIVEFIRLHIS